MFDFYLAINLTAHTFSMRKASMRFPTGRRVFSAFVLLPLFFVLIVVNRMFMFLDWIIFPGFRKMQLVKTAFITGVSRSATTYLYNILASDNAHFTSFKLWEILFAPSVIQKYILLIVIKTDHVIGRPLYRLSLFLDKVFLGRIAKLHEISLSNPEEDEMLLIYAFASMYLAFFFPDNRSLDPHLFFDEDVSPLKRKKIMLFYRRCVQRHVYVFDRKEEKYFLSKNPGFVSKTVSIAQAFPGSKLIYMLRSPLKTIPSTISLNLNVYSIFSGNIPQNTLADQTTNTIIRWYKMADHSMEKYWPNNHLTVPFKKITGQPENTVKKIYQFLDLTPGPMMNLLLKTEQDNCRNYKSEHKYNNETAAANEKIASDLAFILNGKYRDEI